MKHLKLLVRCLCLICSAFAAVHAHASNGDPCTEATALVDARFPEADKAHWLKTLDTCGPASGPKQLAAVNSAIKERARVEIALGDEASGAKDYKSAVRHFEAAVTWVPDDPKAAKQLTTARNVYGKYLTDQVDALLSIGRLDDAIKLLSDPEVRSLGTSSMTQTWERLRQLPRNRMIAEADVGHYDKALDELKTVLEANPNKTFLEISDGNLWLEWATLRAFITANVEFITEAVIICVAGLWLLVRLVRRYYERPILVLRDFDNNKISPGVEQAIQAMLINLSRGSSTSASSALRVTRPLEGVPLPVDISNVLPASASWMQIIPGLVARVFPRRTLPITGVLHKDPSLGAGITIHVVTRGGSHWSETFWEKQFGASKSAKPSTTAHYILAEYVAIWLLFRFSKPSFRILGSNNWRSYAFFRAALNADPDRDAAKKLYVSALSIDDHLHAARLNLGLLAEGKERVLVGDLFSRAADKAEKTDATRYQARYSLASLRYDMDGPDAAIKEMEALFVDLFDTCHVYDLGSALANSVSSYHQELVGQGKPLTIPTAKAITFTSSPILWAKVRFGWQPYPELKHYIDYLMPIARAMSLGLLISKDHLNTTALNKVTEIARTDQSPRVRYNLACAYSLVAAGIASAQPRKVSELQEMLKRGLDSLALSLWLSPEIGRKSRDDKALLQLRTSQERVGDEVASVAFERIVSQYIGTPALLPFSLSEFLIIGPEAAQLLAAINVKSKSDLINKCHTESDRQKLAQEIRAGSNQVKEWATAVELTEIEGIMPQHANLLNRARVMSIHELSRAHAASLYDSLLDWATPLKAVAPSKVVVAAWVVAAQQMASSIT